MLALAFLPSRRAIRSIPSSAWSRSPLEILTFLAVYSTSIVSLRSLFWQQDAPAGELRILYRTGFSCQFSVQGTELQPWGNREKAMANTPYLQTTKLRTEN